MALSRASIACCIVAALCGGCGDRGELRRCRDVRAELAKQNAALRAREQAQKTVLARLQREASSQPTDSGAAGDTPKSASSQPVTNVLVSVDKRGKLALEGQAMTLAQLKAALAARHSKTPDARVLVTADVRAPHKHVFRLLDLAKSVGFRRIGIKTQAP